MMQVTEAVKHLLIINILVFIGANTFFNPIEATVHFGLFNPASDFFRPWQLITHMFMHANMMHIMFNMFALLSIGPLIENYLGTKRFALFYLACGLGGALMHFAFQYYSFHFLSNPYAYDTPAVGASAAINGIFIALAYLYPEIEMNIMFIPIPIKAKYLAFGLIGVDLFFGVTGASTGVGHFAHLGGALLGFLLILNWSKNKY